MGPGEVLASTGRQAQPLPRLCPADPARAVRVALLLNRLGQEVRRGRLEGLCAEGAQHRGALEGG